MASGSVVADTSHPDFGGPRCIADWSTCQPPGFSSFLLLHERMQREEGGQKGFFVSQTSTLRLFNFGSPGCCSHISRAQIIRPRFSTVFGWRHTSWCIPTSRPENNPPAVPVPTTPLAGQPGSDGFATGLDFATGRSADVVRVLATKPGLHSWDEALRCILGTIPLLQGWWCEV